jgi:hypothetical protein
VLDAHESLFSDVGYNPSVFYESSTGVVPDMYTKNVHQNADYEEPSI